jgi:leader peptidase (prepilin peptidase)/N-methyltransferase
MIPELIPIYIVIFLFGIVIGSFLNVCIFRIPKQETVVTERSHCMSCGYQLAWYDMVPVASWLFLRGRCRKCGQPISPQYPIIEAANGAAYVLVFAVNDFSLQSILYCLLMSALLVLAVIDWRSYEIPIGINIFILCLGILQVLLDIQNWMDYAAGFLCISMFLFLLLVVSKGRAIGGGDVKLMAAAGLLLGWKNIILAFLLGCIIGSVIHLLRMKLSGADHVLAMGPYLAVGIAVAALWGDNLINWYISLL